MHPHNFLIFDIETIPDIDGIRLLNELSPDMKDDEVADFAFALHKEKTGNAFLPHYLQKIVCLSLMLQTQQELKVFSLSSPQMSEAQIIHTFFKGIQKYRAQLVSWNGSGFDLPVLHYRAMKNGVEAPYYWDLGENNPDFKWNNYINRYHFRHLDLMDVLSLYNTRTAAPLDKLAKLLGFPGKLGVDGSEVWNYWLQKRADEIRQYCETDVANTYLLFLRFRQMKGEITKAMEQEQWEKMRIYLEQISESQMQNNDHWLAFLESWQNLNEQGE